MVTYARALIGNLLNVSGDVLNPNLREALPHIQFFLRLRDQEKKLRKVVSEWTEKGVLEEDLIYYNILIDLQKVFDSYPKIVSDNTDRLCGEILDVLEGKYGYERRAYK